MDEFMERIDTINKNRNFLKGDPFSFVSYATEQSNLNSNIEKAMKNFNRRHANA